MSYHRLLQRQLKRLNLEEGEYPSVPDQWDRLLDIVNCTYIDTDNDRYTLERALEVSSEEMEELYEQQKFSYEARIHAIAKALPDPVFLFDEDGRYLEIMTGREDQLCLLPEQLKGRLLHEIHPQERADLFLGAIHTALDTDSLTLVEYDLEVTSGHRFFEGRVMPGNFQVNGRRTVVFLALDITDIRESEKQIRRLAYYDNLTGLASRAHFLQRLDEAIKTARRRKQKFALFFLDLDGFKDINDTLGLEAGDELLKIVGKRLHTVLREIDFAARLGGDEFCIIMEEITDAYDAAQVADRCLEVVREQVVIAGRKLAPRISIGITLFPDDGQEQEQLLRAADSAMYAAKQAGKHQYAFYTPDLTALAEQRLSLENDLRQAIEMEQFELHYQPQVSMNSGRVTAVEALIRWRHPERGLVQPGEFIEVAERIGLISELGEWVLRTACRQLVAWRQAGVPPIRVAVNISSTHFQQEEIVHTVKTLLEETSLEPAALELEITEAVVQATEQSIETFRRLKALGVTIAIDDFGTGYSSLGSLKHLPIDCLKVDRVFIKDVLTDQSDSAIIATVIAMGQVMGLSVVAEGVETFEQVKYLYGIGCDSVQGFYFSKPVPADRIPELVATDFLLGRGRSRQPGLVGT